MTEPKDKPVRHSRAKEPKFCRFNDLPAWQRRGVGLRWETYPKAGLDPRSATPTTTERRRIRLELELPLGEPYAQLVRKLLQDHAEREA